MGFPIKFSNFEQVLFWSLGHLRDFGNVKFNLYVVHANFQFRFMINKIGDINDPLSQSHRPAGSDICIFEKLRRTHNSCENMDHYLQWLWVGLVDQ